MTAAHSHEDIEALKRQGQFENALALIEAKLAEDPQQIEWLLERGHCARLIGNFEVAEAAYNDAWAAADVEDDPYAALDAMLGLVSTYRAIGNYGQALGLLAEARDLIEDLDDQESLPHFYWIEGTVMRYSGQLDLAAERLAKGLEIAKRLADREGEGYILAALGGLSRVRGDFAATDRYYGEAYGAFRALGDAFGLAYTACGCGNAARMQGKWNEAETFFAEAADRYKVFGDRVSYAYTLWAWGTLDKMRGHYDVGQEKFAAADDLFVQTGDRRGRAYVQLGYWELDYLRTTGTRPKADAVRQALSDWRQSGLPLEAAYGELLLACAGAGDVAAANATLASLGTVWHSEALPLNLP